MENKLFKFSLVCVTGAIILATNPKTALAFEEPVAGYIYDKDLSSTKLNGSDMVTVSTFTSDEIPIPGFNNIGIADVTDNLNIRKGPGENEKIVGKLPKDGSVDIVEADSGNGWTKINSNGVTGYVKTEFLITGDRASKLAAKLATPVAISKTDGLNVRNKPSAKDSEVIDTIAKGEELLVLDQLVLNYGDEYDKWVKVSLDSDTQEGTVGYVCKEYVTLAYTLPKASSMEELQYGSGVSSLRVNLVNKAKDYLGGRYVWGGTRLGEGVDCSGFTQQIYAKFGYYIPRTSGSQGSSGTRISRSELKVGDLVFYGNGSGINHVAIYIGNDRIIHASNKRDGIKISNMYYRNPVRYVRYIRD